MLQHVKRFVTTLVLAVAMFAPFAVPAMAHAEEANIQGNLCGGVLLQSDASNNCGANDSAAKDKINGIISTIINIFSLLVGFVAVIMIIVGGFKYITSGGDSGNISSAKNTIIYALVGLVIVALAQFMVRFVLSKVTS